MSAARGFVIGTLVAAMAMSGCEWSFQTLDGDGGSHGQSINAVGSASSAVVYNGRPHVFYYDITDGRLRHGYWNGQFWAFETLDGHRSGPHGEVMRDVGEHVSAIVYNGRPHVFYRDTGAVELRHGYYNGQYWAFETLDGHRVGPHGELVANTGEYITAILYNGRPHVFYYDRTNESLRHGYYNGLFWVYETLDGDGGPNGRTTNDVGWSTAVVVYNGLPHVFYRDLDGLDLRHGYFTGSGWGFETLDGHMNGPNGRKLGNAGVDNSATIYNGRPHVFYAIVSPDSDLRHAYFTGSGWGFETLDGHQNGPNGRIQGTVGARAPRSSRRDGCGCSTGTEGTTACATATSPGRDGASRRSTAIRTAPTARFTARPVGGRQFWPTETAHVSSTRAERPPTTCATAGSADGRFG